MSKGLGKFQRLILAVLHGKDRKIYARSMTLTTPEITDELIDSGCLQNSRKSNVQRVYQALLRLYAAGLVTAQRTLEYEHGAFSCWEWGIKKQEVSNEQ
jgi:hypothetical protein